MYHMATVMMKVLITGGFFKIFGSETWTAWGLHTIHYSVQYNVHVATVMKVLITCVIGYLVWRAGLLGILQPSLFIPYQFVLCSMNILTPSTKIL